MKRDENETMYQKVVIINPLCMYLEENTRIMLAFWSKKFDTVTGNQGLPAGKTEKICL
jgi:hypothetical protein